MTESVVMETPLGNLKVVAANEAVTYSFWADDPIQISTSSRVLKSAMRQMDEYFAGVRKGFDLPLCAKGTKFQQSVWFNLLEIPYGKTISYQQLAESVGNVKACRAVGSANSVNPIGIIIPCHRVIRASGDLGGYAGNLERKQFLLGLEKRFS